MCPPVHYRVPEPHPEGGYANEMQVEGFQIFQKDPEGFKERAQEQWLALRTALVQAGAEILEIQAHPDLPDQVFTADPSISLQDKGYLVTILSHFSNAERQPEVELTQNFLSHHGERTFVELSHHLEGTGDNIYDPARDLFWSGYTPETGRENAAQGRSNILAHKDLQKATGVEVISLEVQTPFFHVDTSLALLPKGHILCYPDGLSQKAFNTVKKRGLEAYGLDPQTHLFTVSKDEAAAYTCNVRAIENTLIMSACEAPLRKKLEDAGYHVVILDLSMFLASGGGVHCLTNHIFEPRIEGGTLS